MATSAEDIAVREILSDGVLSTFDLDITEARGLPNEAFTSDAYFAMEQKRLFARTWVFAGLASELPNAGDVRPVEVAGRPVILTRGNDGKIRVFQNVCPHRGARLVIENLDGNAMMTCPYHAWTYAMDGKLKSRPHFHKPDCHDTEGDDNISLFPVRSTTWYDWVFVNLDGKAEPFEDHIAPVEEWFQGFPLDPMRCAEHRVFEFECNWKLAVENYCDFYHVFLVHPALHQSMSKETRKSMQCMGRHLMNDYWFDTESRGGLGDKSAVGMNLIPGLKPEYAGKQVYSAIFPNMAVNVYPSNAQCVLFEPVSPGKTRMHMWFYFVDGDHTNPAFADERDNLYQEWAALNAEDEGICRRLQEGRMCDAYDGGRLAPYWDQGTIHFHRQLAEVMTA
ncbi:MAG: aromatic ring-hydroxylating dioxygenase subunit alpha [Alphaproteobacteria bacterium]|jgi:choline monooxygenase|nr:aromatic ring-hydroxylating dioxygenase subunit alpha [Rhodospirillaceae bacterium]MBT7614248.1 aromatic ring-hydroxylating dioxygenase subunit alpha [Rhodospirillaceae bacterium]MDG2481227.1 aromatic ring-hydroxylating dioxygenase subunit alpha [Alphaproteobacteria bacterium]